MRNGQNKQRMRNRNNNNNNNRRGQNPMTRVYESNGPDIKIRGTASHIAEKYLQLARDARSSGDPVAAENYYQHAEHYFRLIAAAQEQFRQNQQQPRGDEPTASNDDGEDDGENFSAFGQEPGFVPQPPQQPFMRDRDGQRDQQRENQQPYHRDQQQPREHRERDHRPQPQYQPPQPPNQPQPVIADAGNVDRLPSFITGAQPQVNVGANGGQGGFEGGGGSERYPRRRRRPHGPRPEREAAPAASNDDLAPGE
ncbi:DUF4167 domain-containing protein [Bradyrhizobium sp. 147]|uniref:DUF4167 domain-containing protein n=1 Tax=unclassified Bradyrhizobium TaxID=2631580 RepID=UPI001FFB652D|nr:MULTISPECIES: DUF4167 domain-containing protein [unclassified Bradyrhizobium]MCK1419831.1 DUF4167 domain-containing protein [Bradyrhizobium sp. CW12]MCK1529690.1 DUF4167 domain-containing protein [Bradyrhizobium sp. 182]MCK1542065.1 DUF4167 domain-containing protein [Bradyrhizobium sp. 179]MCK1593756.1 DUF4167 domain-containing protein [Bradyrhizobium sp. 164]MCK1617025.1 DUF4167 domain-containing protein [Bradyrhizobium sp. 159]